MTIIMRFQTKDISMSKRQKLLAEPYLGQITKELIYAPGAHKFLSVTLQKVLSYLIRSSDRQ